MSAARTLPFVFLAVLAAATLFPLAGCGSEPPAPGAVAMDAAQHEAWEIALVEMRIDKNEEFSDPERTPLPAEKLPGFEGLNYYFPKPELRFRTQLLAEAKPDTVRLAKRKGNDVRYVRRGTVAFSHAGKVHRLGVFAPVDPGADGHLWLPFYDATSGKETYGGGRYLDLRRDADGLIDLDFNYAYNPLCDYNPDAFNCTLPPRENTLEFAVEAGEKLFAGDH
ncbi:MAG: DUF1684 domain-containing protein [bacterium]|nr:DUF1684 domain-containing protein [bacterium]